MSRATRVMSWVGSVAPATMAAAATATATIARRADRDRTDGASGRPRVRGTAHVGVGRVGRSQVEGAAHIEFLVTITQKPWSRILEIVKICWLKPAPAASDQHPGGVHDGEAGQQPGHDRAAHHQGSRARAASPSAGRSGSPPGRWRRRRWRGRPPTTAANRPARRARRRRWSGRRRPRRAERTARSRRGSRPAAPRSRGPRWCCGA